MNKNHDLLRRIADPLELNVSRETFEKFIIYKDLLKEWNQKINLTAITDDDEIFLKHFADSISIFHLKEVKQAKTVIDVGTGAGFPGLPMKIINPSLKLTCLDPLNKRLNFLREVSKEIDLHDISFIHGRAEDVSRETSHRDNYDLAVSRAVALLPTLMEFCLPFVAQDKFFVAMKGPEIENEIEISKRLFSQLSSELVKIEQIPDLDEYEHNLVLIKKVKLTNSKYPRKFTQIKKDNQMYKDLLSKSRI